MMKFRRLSFIAASGSLALIISGCAADPKSGGSIESDCGSTLKFGILTSITGEFASFGRASKDGMELVFDSMRSSSALKQDWKIESVVADDETKVEPGLRGANNLIRNEHVSAILGPFSGLAVALVPETARTQTPIVTMFGSTVKLDTLGGEWIYRTIGSDSDEGLAAAQWMIDQKRETVSILTASDESAVSAGRSLQKSYESEGGEVLNFSQFESGDASYNALIQQTIEANPQAIYLAAGQESGVSVINGLLAAGYPIDQILGSSDLPVPDVINGIGADNAAGLQALTPAPDEGTPEYKRFAKVYEEEYGVAPIPFVPQAYDAAMIAALAAVAADSTCGAAINAKVIDVAGPPGKIVSTFDEGVDALNSGNDIDYQGASGPIDFDASGTANASYSILGVKGGEWTQVHFYTADELTK